MDQRIPLLAEQLLLIERELRLQNWWSEQPPMSEALASQQPFCVDTLAFEQWLQWIFLPRMKQLLESAAALPTTERHIPPVPGASAPTTFNVLSSIPYTLLID